MKSVRRVNGATECGIGDGGRKSGGIEGLGMRRRGWSAIGAQDWRARRCETSSGKFFGRRETVSPGTYETGCGRVIVI